MGAGAAAQEECPSGRYSSSTGTTQCSQAQAGYHTTDGSSTAVNSGATAQVGCASGYYSAAGSTQCSQALAGYYTTDGSGAVTDGAGAAAQEECPSGRYSGSSGTTQCSQAQKGYYTVSAIGGTTPSNSGALDETLALAGYFTVDGNNNAVASGAVNVRQA